jgi:hypothetical protein
VSGVNGRWVIVAAFWFAGLLCGESPAQAAAKQIPPSVMFWSWFAEDDFRPFAGRDIGVAYLALSLQFEGQDQVTPSPRAIPVRIPPQMYQMAVIRFDTWPDPPRRAALTGRQRELAVRMVAEIAAITHPKGIQIDFDALPGAWPFYRQLLSEVRARIGPDIFLSITALVSWCDSAQSWLAGLPVDEIVPMAFSMGQVTPAIVTMLERGGQFQFPGCRASIGVGMQEDYSVPRPRAYMAMVGPRKGQRAYFFPGGHQWSTELLSSAQKAVRP